jgi:hypothetical protein
VALVDFGIYNWKRHSTGFLIAMLKNPYYKGYEWSKRMKSKDILRNYMAALDAYREDPNRTNKDHLLEAECETREKLNIPTEHLADLYKGR